MSHDPTTAFVSDPTTTLVLALTTAALNFGSGVVGAIRGPRDAGSHWQAGNDATTTGGDQPRVSEQFLTEVISDSSVHLAKLITEVRDHIEEAIHRQSVLESIQLVQAKVNALRRLTDVKSRDDAKIADHLVLSLLSPMHESLELAKLRLEMSGATEVWRYVNIVGTSALLSGYAFLGHDKPDLREEMEAEMHAIRIRVLNDLAPKLIASPDHAFPWEQVPHLLTAEGSADLSALYLRYLETASAPEERALLGNYRDLVDMFKGFDQKAGLSQFVQGISAARLFARKPRLP